MLFLLETLRQIAYPVAFFRPSRSGEHLDHLSAPSTQEVVRTQSKELGLLQFKSRGLPWTEYVSCLQLWFIWILIVENPGDRAISASWTDREGALGRCTARWYQPTRLVKVDDSSSNAIPRYSFGNDRTVCGASFM
jgi:hypothetical protein